MTKRALEGQKPEGFCCDAASEAAVASQSRECGLKPPPFPAHSLRFHFTSTSIIGKRILPAFCNDLNTFIPTFTQDLMRENEKTEQDCSFLNKETACIFRLHASFTISFLIM